MSYRVQSNDTSQEVEKLQLDFLRQKGALGRIRLMRSLTATTRRLSWNNFRQLHPKLDKLAVFEHFIALTYGNKSGDELKNYFTLQNQTGQTTFTEKVMISEDMLDALIPVINVFETLNISYLIAGSVASSTHGIARSTADADLVADLKPENVNDFVARLEPDYYVSRTAIEEALNRRSSFNLLHFATGIKVDIFVLKTDQFNQTSFSRAKKVQLDQASNREFRVDAPEDVLLQKLNWYRMAGGISDKQWLDVLGIMKIQAANLDLAYLKEWAEKLGLTELLSRALDESGLAS